MVSTSKLTDADRDSLTQWAQGFSGRRAVIVTGLQSLVEDIVASHLEERAAAIEAEHNAPRPMILGFNDGLLRAARIVREWGAR